MRVVTLISKSSDATYHWTSGGCTVFSEDGTVRQRVRKWKTVWHSGDAWGIPKPEPEPLAGGLRKLQRRSRSTDILSASSRVAL